MTAFGMTCSCGRSVSVECRSFSEILSANARMMQQGWGYDRQGRVRCPDCIEHPGEAPKPEPATSRQGDLFA